MQPAEWLTLLVGLLAIAASIGFGRVRVLAGYKGYSAGLLTTAFQWFLILGLGIVGVCFVVVALV